MAGRGSSFSEFWDYAKSVWGIVSFLSTLAGPGGTYLVPVVPKYAKTAALWAFVFSAFSIVLIFSLYWRPRRRVSCWWSVPLLALAVAAGAVYAFLYDYLPLTHYPIRYPTWTEHVLSVSYAIIFGFLTAVFGVLRTCGNAKAVS